MLDVFFVHALKAAQAEAPVDEPDLPEPLRATDGEIPVGWDFCQGPMGMIYVRSAPVEALRVLLPTAKFWHFRDEPEPFYLWQTLDMRELLRPGRSVEAALRGDELRAMRARSPEFVVAADARKAARIFCWDPPEGPRAFRRLYEAEGWYGLEFVDVPG